MPAVSPLSWVATPVQLSVLGLIASGLIAAWMRHQPSSLDRRRWESIGRIWQSVSVVVTALLGLSLVVIACGGIEMFGRWASTIVSVGLGPWGSTAMLLSLGAAVLRRTEACRFERGRPQTMLRVLTVAMPWLVCGWAALQLLRVVSLAAGESLAAGGSLATGVWAGAPAGLIGGWLSLAIVTPMGYANDRRSVTIRSWMIAISTMLSIPIALWHGGSVWGGNALLMFATAIQLWWTVLLLVTTTSRPNRLVRGIHRPRLVRSRVWKWSHAMSAVGLVGLVHVSVQRYTTLDPNLLDLAAAVCVTNIVAVRLTRMSVPMGRRRIDLLFDNGLMMVLAAIAATDLIGLIANIVYRDGWGIRDDYWAMFRGVAYLAAVACVGGEFRGIDRHRSTAAFKRIAEEVMASVGGSLVLCVIARWLVSMTDATRESMATIAVISLMITPMIRLAWTSGKSKHLQTRRARIVTALAAWSLGAATVTFETFTRSGSTGGGIAVLIVMSLMVGIVLWHVDRWNDRWRTAGAIITAATLLGWSWVGVSDRDPTSFFAAARSLTAGWMMAVAAVIFIPSRLTAATATRWQHPLRRTRNVSLGVTAASMVLLFGVELAYRTLIAQQVSRVSVLGIAVVLAGIAATAGWIAIRSRPGNDTAAVRPAWLQLSDHRRRGMLVLAEALCGLTWLHIYLCKPRIAVFGLRDYWPIVVFVIAFVSVGLSHWARRRGDAVVASTLGGTSLLLPIVPVIGFWIARGAGFGGPWAGTWEFRGGLDYTIVLTIGAIFYLASSQLLSQRSPRWIGGALAAGALWVYLTDEVSMSFLAHPQMWLLPPAVLVLILVQIDRKALAPSTASALRYAATTVIYVTSTAEMLMDGLGQNLWGPIVLIVLALIGIAVGIAMRVRAYLYLGTLFVTLGLLSMVYHAGQSLDSVWPWWAFGITTGAVILAALVTLEKYRPSIERYRARLESWEG